MEEEELRGIEAEIEAEVGYCRAHKAALKQARAHLLRLQVQEGAGCREW